MEKNSKKKIKNDLSKNSNFFAKFKSLFYNQSTLEEERSSFQAMLSNVSNP